MIINVVCDQCGKQNKREVPIIDPRQFSDPEKALFLTSYYCSHCEGPQVVQYIFRLDEQDNPTVKYLRHIEPTSVFTADTKERGITVRCKQKKHNR